MSFVRVAASAAIVILLSAAGATAKPIAVSTDTNLRKAAGTNSEVLTLIPKGTSVEIGKCSNGWCEASLNGQDGFVIAQNVGMGRRPPPGGGPAVQIIEDDDAPATAPLHRGTAGLWTLLRLRSVLRLRLWLGLPRLGRLGLGTALVARAIFGRRSPAAPTPWRRSICPQR